VSFVLKASVCVAAVSARQTPGSQGRRQPPEEDTLLFMNTTPQQPNITFVQTNDYREAYANSVQIRVNVWDFFLVFGTMQQSSETQMELNNFQGIYLSPQQAKALMTLMQQNISNYEAAFGEIKLDPRAPGGPIH
jgi:Protein of unknown function (DUF3467)